MALRQVTFLTVYESRLCLLKRFSNIEHLAVGLFSVAFLLNIRLQVEAEHTTPLFSLTGSGPVTRGLQRRHSQKDNQVDVSGSEFPHAKEGIETSHLSLTPGVRLS
uniref:Uncharacterized protein n=1 Tax=Nothobranchius kadleci TaxID=1051664 RepID=A0A1A8BQ04_NOTKA